TVNQAAPAEKFRAVGLTTVGEENVHWQVKTSRESEMFTGMREEWPSAYFWLGADGEEPSARLHNALFDFNEALLPIGIRFWQNLVEQALPIA
ncbi:MAG TPA: amidohydrolase, partial [Pantoea sp.]|nr:amidohydrolase [Pantoea sp.]